MLLAGADVTHSRSFDSSEPSVAAVVGSLNRSATRYSCRVKIQGYRQEMIQVSHIIDAICTFPLLPFFHAEVQL